MTKSIFQVFLAFIFSTSIYSASYFPKLEKELKSKGLFGPTLFIDLDRLDHNIETLKNNLAPGIDLRLVSKSLPSMHLMSYIMAKAQTNKIMVFHHPFLPHLIEGLPASTEFLFGKTIPAAAAAYLLKKHPNEITPNLDRIIWLVDNAKTLHNFLTVFKHYHQKFKVSFEVDVGMHRGGARKSSELMAMLEMARKNRKWVQVTGLMGYDGHVIHHPIPGTKPVAKELNRVIKRYRHFLDVLAHYSDLKPKSGWILNGAGSSTYSLYKKGAPINEASVGSAVLKGSDFDYFTLKKHLPAFYISTPVLKKVPHAEIPFLGLLGTSFNKIFRRGMTGFYVYAGGHSDHVVFPSFLRPSKLVNETPNRNIVSNQSYLIGRVPKGSKFDVGSFVFFRPIQNDTLFLFEDIILIRDGQIVGKWKPFSWRL